MDGIRGPKGPCFSTSPSSEYSGSISCRIDWCDLLAVQGTLNALNRCEALGLLLLTLTSLLAATIVVTGIITSTAWGFCKD